MNKNIYFGLLCLMVALPAWGMEKEKFIIFNDEYQTYTSFPKKTKLLSDEQFACIMLQIAHKKDLAIEERLRELKKWLDFGANPNARGLLGQSLLQILISSGDTQLVEELLKHPSVEIWMPDHVNYAQEVFSKEKDETKKAEREGIYNLVKEAKEKRIERAKEWEKTKYLGQPSGVSEITLITQALTLEDSNKQGEDSSNSIAPSSISGASSSSCN